MTIPRRFLVFALALPLLVVGARKGDVSLEGSVDARDALLLQRALKGDLLLGAEAEDAADVAPLGPPVGDGNVDPGDLGVLLRAIGGEDVDGDGLPAWFENLAGTFPFALDSDANGIDDDLEDSDGDGIPNWAEYGARSNPGNEDSDGDGVPDWLEGAAAPEPGVATNLDDAAAFLYEGATAVQTGVAQGTIEPLRVAVLRGSVGTPGGAPLAGVTVSVQGRPELGQTLSRTSGEFDLAVNGGGVLTLDYARLGLLAVQRQVMAPWQGWAVLPDVVMIALDPVSEEIVLDDTVWQVATASEVTDGSGTRRPRLLVPPGTTATFLGTSVPVPASLTMRLTEYTVGASGPEAMPGLLPPSSAYTYALEISADEAQAAGASHIQFRPPGGSEPRPVLYLENFLGFPVGMPVPWGSYDKGKAGWSAEESGRVVRLVAVGGGALGIDIDNDGVADPGEYGALGVLAGELETLASEGYAPDAVLWRVPLAQASPGDGNLAPSPPNDAKAPPTPAPKEEPPDDCNAECGSTLRAERRTVGEAVELVGVPFRLHYESDRTPGYLAARRLEIPLRDETDPPASLQEMRVEVSVGGIRTVASQVPSVADPYEFEWTGLDAYGRELSGRQPITVKLSYVYPFSYRWTTTFNLVDSAAPAAGGVGRLTGSLSSEWRGQIGAFDARGTGLGGWSLAVHHSYDPYAKVLYQGDGVRRSAKSLPDVVAATSLLSAPASSDHEVAIAPDGTVYVSWGRTVQRLESNGSFTQVAGGGLATGDGGPATQAKLGLVSGLAVGADGSFYIAASETDFHKAWKVDASGIITTVAGTGAQGGLGDGGAAVLAQLNNPQQLSLAADGTLYIADRGNNRVRKVEPNGVIRTVAGDGTNDPYMPAHDGSLATAVPIGAVEGIALGGDGSLYLSSDSHRRVRRVSPDGILSTVAGNGAASCDPDDGEEATSTCLADPRNLAIAPDGGLLIADRSDHRVRRVAPDGLISTVAGTGSTTGEEGTGGPAAATVLETPAALALGPGGELYATEFNTHRLRKIAPALPAYSVGDLFVPSRDGSEIYRFDASGRHLATLEARTGAALYAFEYTADGTLDLVRDASGNETRIERNASGDPTAILAPFGQRTELELDANGWLAAIRNPADEEHGFTYTAEGLLETYTTPNGGAPRSYDYDAEGRLELASDPGGGARSFTPVEATSRTLAVQVVTGEGRETTYRIEKKGNGDEERRTRLRTSPTQTLDTESVRSRSGSVVRTDPDGTVTTVAEGPDPRFGLMAPLPASFEVQTPASAGAPAGRIFEGTFTRSAPTFDAGGEVTAQTDTLVLQKAPSGTRSYTQVYAKTSPTERRVTTTTPEGRLITDLLDVQGRLTSRQVGPLEAVRLEYDAAGRLERIRQGSGAEERATTFGYEAGTGLLDFVEDPLLRRVEIDSYDLAARPTQETLPGGRVVGFDWDANGNLTELTPPGKPAHAFRYTPVDLEREYEPPEAIPAEPTITESTWDGDRRLDLVERPDGTVIDLEYDAASRLGTVTIPQGTIDLTYHATTGQLTSLTAPGGVALALGWGGPLLESQSWSGPVAGSVTFDYESPGMRLTSETVAGATPAEVAFEYDDDGLLTAAGDLDLAPDPDHGLLASTTLGVVTTAYTYNGFGELASDSASVSGSPVYASAYPVRDKLGRIVQKSETLQGTSASFEYSYDPAGRLDTVTRTPEGGSAVLVADHAYDLNGNRLCTNESAGACPASAVYDEQDRLVADEVGRTYTYSEAGELETVIEGGQTTAYAYDPLGNLRAVCLGGALPSCAGGTLIAYEIDALGRRIGRRVNGTLQKGFLWSDGLRIAAELDGTGAVVSRFAYAGRPNVPEYMVKGGAAYRILTDHLGSVRLVVDTSTGAVAQRIDYDAWGVPTFVTGPADFQPFGFAGGLYDPDTGLVRFGARDYHPRVGRWTSKDPIRFRGASPNLYDYGIGDPVNLVDPSGRHPLLIVLGYTLVASGAVAAAGSAVAAGFAALLDPKGIGADAGSIASATAIGAGGPAIVGVVLCGAAPVPPLLSAVAGAAPATAAAGRAAVGEVAGATGFTPGVAAFLADFVPAVAVTGPASSSWGGLAGTGVSTAVDLWKRRR